MHDIREEQGQENSTVAGSPGWSLIVASRDGEDTLPDCLASLARIRVPAEGLEVILVDNASTDATGRLMRDFAACTGALFIHEPRPGKSHALNAAIAQSRGDMLVLIDDDVVVDAGMLDAYASAGRQFPGTGILAGQLRPLWRTQPPAWMSGLAEQGRSCGCTPAGLAAGWIAATQAKGGNICFRRTAIADARFSVEDVNFGAGTKRIGGEDTEFIRRVAAAGRVRYVPEALARHIIAAHEATWMNAFSRYLRIGRGNAAQGLAGPGVLKPSARAAAYAGLAFFWIILGRRTAAAGYALQAAMQLGALEYLLVNRN